MSVFVAAVCCLCTSYKHTDIKSLTPYVEGRTYVLILMFTLGHEGRQPDITYTPYTWAYNKAEGVESLKQNYVFTVCRAKPKLSNSNKTKVWANPLYLHVLVLRNTSSQGQGQGGASCAQPRRLPPVLVTGAISKAPSLSKCKCH